MNVLEEVFKDADKNSDGKLTFDEYLMKDKFWVDMQRENFKNRDANGNCRFRFDRVIWYI